LHTPALRIGTDFQLTLETVVFLFHLLSTTSKPFSSLSTRLAHAARLGFFYKNALYKFIVVIIIIVTLAVSVAVCEIISAKEWCDLKNRVRVRSRSLEMARFDRPCMTFC